MHQIEPLGLNIFRKEDFIMTVRDLLELFMEDDCQDVELYDNISEQTVFIGTAFDAMETKYEYCEVDSIDNLSGNTFVVNISA